MSEKELKLNIPQNRAKKMYEDEYIFGTTINFCGNTYMIVNVRDVNLVLGFGGINAEFYEIDPSTLAIHFPDMIDSEGTKIFASLSEDGKGGDICDDESKNLFVTIFIKNALCFKDLEDGFLIKEYETKWSKVTGIQE